MENLKKFLSILLTALLTLGIVTAFCACGNNNDGNIDNNGTLQTDDKNKDNDGNLIDDVEDKMTDDNKNAKNGKTDNKTDNGTTNNTTNGTTGTGTTDKTTDENK